MCCSPYKLNLVFLLNKCVYINIPCDTNDYFPILELCPWHDESTDEITFRRLLSFLCAMAGGKYKSFNDSLKKIIVKDI